MPTNRLAREKSPYLLQHAHNPVDWYPWGEEAFARAARENKPIFLSIGYSTCHWCHVMERESFENEEVAKVLNDSFVSIKVDREERPDVDRVYMLFVQTSTGSGGWPMSVWLTPERKPFFGGTYFPPDNRYGRPGFRAIIENLARAWQQDRTRVEQSGTQVLAQLQQYAGLSRGSETAAGEAGREVLDSGFFAFRRMFDAKLGGFGGAPKFPRPSVHNFLVRYFAESGNDEALEMVLLTLREMAKGGMNDQLGGGFHRYSVDERWFVPHFEKMLYDQAQLATSYLEAFQITRDPQYASAAADIFSYVLRDLAHDDGGFYSAEDADSATDPERPHEKHEGAFYVWTKAEIEGALAPPDAALFYYRFGVEPPGNVSEDPHGEFGGVNILYQAHSLEETATHFNVSPQEARTVLANASAALLDRRSARPRPHRDDKILAGWNGLMISAFAKGAQILDEPRYSDAARGAASFIRRRLYDESRGILLRRYRDGEARIEGFLDDYGFVANALLDLYETSFDREDFLFAARLAEKARELFEDPENGGFYSTAAGSADLVLRLKDDYDGAEPSGNSTIAMALLRLARMTGRDDFRRCAEQTLRAFAPRLKSAGAGLPQMLVAQAFALGRPREIVLAGTREDGSMRRMLGAIRQRFLPSAVVLMAGEAATPMPLMDGRTTAYVCENYACQLPTTDLAELENQLGAPFSSRGEPHSRYNEPMERPGATTLRGNPMTVLGPELKSGDKAPDFQAVDDSLKPVDLAATGKGVRIFSVVPSLDTPVCDAQTKRFNEEAGKLPDVSIYTISMDLPFAQKRWCGAYGVDHVKMVSDHRNGSFGQSYGTLIKDLRIESRAIFVLDKDNVIRHAEYVKEVADHPNYESALQAAKALAGGASTAA